MLPRLGGSAVAWCRDHRVWPVGYCLKYVRTAHGIPAVYPSAISAWNNATGRHHDDPTPPRGVPVFWAGGRYGHVAMSCGDGYVWSTDVRTLGRVDKVSIPALTAAWRMDYLGWAEVYNRVRVYTPPPVLDASGVAKATRERASIAHGRLLKRALAAEVGQGLMNVGSSRLGPAFRRRYARWQRALNFARSAADGIPGKVSLTELGRRHGFDVKP